MFKFDKKIKRNRGMTYVELIVVLSIFAIMSAVSFANYGTFQERVDLRKMTNDIAQQIVRAQKDAMAGKLSANRSFESRPAYGVYFKNSSAPDSNNENVPFNKEFIYFADLNNSKVYDEGDLTEFIEINKGVLLFDIVALGGDNLGITFTRPNSDAVFSSNGVTIDPSALSSVEIIISSPSDIPSSIKVYASGRIQID